MYLQPVIIVLSILSVFGRDIELDTDSNNILATLTDCVKNYNATAQQLEAINADAQLVEEKVHCVTACIMKLRGTMAQDGKFNKAGLIEKVSKDFPENSSLPPAISACAENRSPDDCKTAKMLFDCLRQKVACPRRSDCALEILFTETL